MKTRSHALAFFTYRLASATDAPGGYSAAAYGLRSTAARPKLLGGSLFNRPKWSTFRPALTRPIAPHPSPAQAGANRSLPARSRDAWSSSERARDQERRRLPFVEAKQ